MNTDKNRELLWRTVPFVMAMLLLALTGIPASAIFGREKAAPAADGIEVWGPAPAPLAMLRGRHRHRLLVHARRTSPLQAYVRDWLGRVDLPGTVRVTVDVDPQSFL